MASLQDRAGNRVIQFTGLDGKRRTLRLGDMNKRDCETVRRHVEAILTAAKLDCKNPAIPSDTAAFIERVSPWLYSKMAAVGLVPETQETVMSAKCFSSKHSYPPVPTKTIPVTSNGKGLPRCPGVYFIWRDGSVVYVGESGKLSLRVRHSYKHNKIFPGDEVSFIATEDCQFAECYYIGLLRPFRNFRDPADCQP